MKVKPLLEKINPSTFIDDLLKAYGVRCDIDSYLTPTPILFEYHHSYDNMNEAYELLLSTINHENNLEHIYLIQDSDTDGVCSAGLMYSYLKQVNPNVEIQVLFHQGKQHGLYLNLLEEIENNSLILIPDASVTPKKKIYESLIEKNCFCIETDHHDTDHVHPNIITINNQRSDKVNNKNLSGTGVTFKFCQYIDEQLGCRYAEDYYDLVAVSVVSDICDLSAEENRAFIYYGLEYGEVKNPLLKLMFHDLAKDSMTPKDVGWSVSPKVNALCRVGTQEAKELFFNAFVGKGDIQEALDVAKKAHNLQSREVRKIADEIEPKLDLDRNAIVTYIDENDRAYSGLIANRLIGKYRKPAFVLRDVSQSILSGSVRSPIDVASLINETGLAKCNGHQTACGIIVKKNKIEDLVTWFDEKELDDSIVVTATIAPKQATVRLAKACQSNSHLWGHGIIEPKFYIKSTINGRDVIVYQKKNNTIKFNIDGVNFLKFKATDEEVEKFTQGKTMDIEMIVSLEPNEWRGRVSAQGIIEDYTLTHRKLKTIGSKNWSNLW